MASELSVEEEFSKNLVALVRSNPEALSEIIEKMGSSEKLMCLFGFTVVEPTVMAALSVAKKDSSDFDIADFILAAGESCSRKRENEVLHRRLWWIMFGAAIMMHNWKWAGSVPDPGAKMWCSLISSIDIAERALTNNVIWAADEKSSFVGGKPRQIMETFGSVYMPKIYRDNPRWLAFRRDLWARA